MSKKVIRTRRFQLFLAAGAMGAVLVAALIAVFAAPAHVIPIPELDLAPMEPQVAEKISSHVDAVKALPDSHETWGNLGVVLHAHGLDAEAAACYRQAIELEPKNFRWHYLLAHALRKFDAEAALTQTAAALVVDAGYSPLHVLRAELLEENGDNELALRHYETALSLDPESASAAFGAGRLYLAKGELDRALTLLRRAAELDAEAGAIHASLAQLYRRRGEREKAVREARLAAERKSAVTINDTLHFQMTRASVSSIAQLDRAIEATKAGDYPRAERLYRELVKLRPDDDDMHARLGDTLARREEPGEAIEHYQAAIAINPDHASALYGLGNVMNIQGRFDEAERSYRKALELRPDHVPTLLNLGALVAFRGSHVEAERLFRRGLDVAPDDFGCHRQLGELLLQSGDTAEAIEHFEAALASTPDSGPVHASLAIALGRRGRFAEALEHARQAQRQGTEVPPRVVEALEQAVR